jgi:serine/threonine protein kinase
LSRLKFAHPNIARYFIDQNEPEARITEGFNSVSLEEFLARNKKTISLSTKFDVMFQLCHAIQYMHKNSVGCFVRPSDVIVD